MTSGQGHAISLTLPAGPTFNITLTFPTRLWEREIRLSAVDGVSRLAKHRSQPIIVRQRGRRPATSDSAPATYPKMMTVLQGGSLRGGRRASARASWQADKCSS
jgi:hypothetical protein